MITLLLMFMVVLLLLLFVPLIFTSIAVISKRLALAVLVLFLFWISPVFADDYEDLDMNVKVVAGVVTNALLTDYSGDPVIMGVDTKHKIFFNMPETGTGMARVQIPYVKNGRQTAQIQINWHNHKIVGVMYQAKLGDKQKPITGLDGKDIRTL